MIKLIHKLKLVLGLVGLVVTAQTSYGQGCYAQLGEPIAFTATGGNLSQDYTTLYLLTDAGGGVVASSNTNSFPDQAEGSYQIYSINYLQGSQVNVPEVGQNISTTTGDCMELSAAFSITVCPEEDTAIECYKYTGENLVFNVMGGNTAATYATTYFLTDLSGVVIASAQVADFGPSHLTGAYQIYAANYLVASNVVLPNVGQMITSISGDCFDLSSPFSFTICSSTCHCPGTPISLIANGGNADPDYATSYVLVNATGEIEMIDDVKPSFETTGLDGGMYSIYPINYKISDGITGLAEGSSFAGIQGSCLDIGLSYPVELCEELSCVITEGETNVGCDVILGDFSVTGMGGTGPYSFSIDGINFHNSGAFSDLGVGSYAVYIRDANGCESMCGNVMITSCLPIFDLAMTKGLTSPNVTSYDVWDDVEYEIVVINEGNVTAVDTEVIDYLQPGMVYSPLDTNNWTEDVNGNLRKTITTPIAPGESIAIQIVMRITPQAIINGLDELWNIAEITGSGTIVGTTLVDIDSTPDDDIDNDVSEDDNDRQLIKVEPLDPYGFIYCDKTGKIIEGGLVTVSGPGNIVYGVAADGTVLNGLNGIYQFFVDAAGVYDITYTHPDGYPLSTSCLPLGLYDPTGLDGSSSDRDGVVNNEIVLGMGMTAGYLDDISCGENPYFLSVEIVPANPPSISLNNIPVSCGLISGNVCNESNLGLGLDGITMQLFDCTDLNTPIATVSTTNGGDYAFTDLIQGCYQVQAVVDPEFSVTPSSFVDANGLSTPVNLSWGQCFDSGDLCMSEQLSLVKLGNRVWQDCNGNGIQDAGENGLENIRVSLFNSNDMLVQVTMSDQTGMYLFEGLAAGSYYVMVEPSDWEYTPFNMGGNTTLDSDLDGSNGVGTTPLVMLSPGECNFEDFDIGLYKCSPVGDFIWYDLDHNDVLDAEENGVNGVLVKAHRLTNGSWIEYESTYSGHRPGTASDDGYWKMCLPPGEYYIEYANLPTSLVPVIPNVGSNEDRDSDVTGRFGRTTTSSFSLQCGSEKCDLGFGIYRMGTIGDYVWHDSNMNGVRDGSERGVSDVLVQAIDTDGHPVAEARTDADGKYFLDYLQKGDVYLEVELPLGYELTLPNAGSDEMVDSDIDGSNGEMTTATYFISPGEHIPSVDIGLVGQTLPLEWKSFSGEYKETHNQLEWSTFSEINVSYFELERSIDDSMSFVFLGKVLANGDSNEISEYEFEDYDLFRGSVHYYRLKQYDLDGQFSYSDIISIQAGDRDETAYKVGIYPNPVDDVLFIHYEGGLMQYDLDVAIYDPIGRLVQDSRVAINRINTNQEYYQLDLSHLTEGVYLVKTSLNGVYELQPVVISRD